MKSFEGRSEKTTKKEFAGLAQEVRKKALILWGANWEDDIDDKSKENFASLLPQNSKTDIQQILSEFNKEAAWDDKHYVSMLLDVLEGKDIVTKSADMIGLKKVMERAEQIKRPVLSEVFSSITTTLAEEEIEQPDVLPTIEGLHADILSSSDEGDVAQLLLDLGNGLKRSLANGKLGVFFEAHPEFWHYLNYAKNTLQ